MNALHWLRRAWDGEEGVGEVRDALLGASDAEAARPMALALSRAGATRALGEILERGGDAARLAAIEALETMAGTPAAEVALAGHASETSQWLRRRRVRLAAQRGVASESIWNAEDPGVCAVLLEADLATDPALESALLQAGSRSGRLWAELAWWAARRVASRAEARGPDVGLAPAVEALGEHGNAFVRAQAARALVALGLTPGFDVAGLWREDVPVDLEGVRALDDAVVEDVERAAVALRLTTDLDVALAAVGRLAGSASDPARHALCEGTDHPRPQVRTAAARGLDGRTGPAVWSAYDRWVREEPDPERRLSVLWTVSRRREPEALELLLGWSDLADIEVRRESVRGLAERVRKSRRARTDAVRRALDRRARDEDGEIRRLVEQALGRF